MTDMLTITKGSLTSTMEKRKPSSDASASRSATPSRKSDRAHARRRNTLLDLLSPFYHLDHKVTGACYIISQVVTFYYIFARFQNYESSLFLTMLTPILGCIVTLTALRNFHFLPKQAENPGMFAENRTFSYAFLQENLWFQLLLTFTFFAVAPTTSSLMGPYVSLGSVLFLFYMREIVPKTSYTSWKSGNEKVNKKKYDSWSVKFVNAQVKIVRWNYVLKKTLLYYMIANSALEALGFTAVGSVSPFDRKMHYILTLDAMHNITTAFFIQTLKFKGFISAFTFSMLFNASPMLGLVFTYYLCAYHSFKWILALACAIDLAFNLFVVYPSKLSHVQKNRVNFAGKAITTLAAVCYYAVNAQQ